MSKVYRVKIKPLVWQYSKGEWIACGVDGIEYCVYRKGNRFIASFFVDEVEVRSSALGRQASQADHDQRVLSLLEVVEEAKS